MRPSRILVVDDEPGIRESLSGILEDEGYEATAVETGEDCLSLLNEKTYHVVLLDIWLPAMDGLETLERIQQLDPSRRPIVVVISGHGTIESAVRATKLGALDFLEKGRFPLEKGSTVLRPRNALSKRRRLLIENLSLREQGQDEVQDHRREHPDEKALRQQLETDGPRPTGPCF